MSDWNETIQSDEFKALSQPMTNPTPPDAPEQSRDGLLACPFCGVAIEQDEYGIEHPHNNECLLGSASFGLSNIPLWNTRVSRPSLEPTLGSHTEGVWAMPSARSGVLRTEPEDVSALRAPATIANGDA